MPPLWTPIPQDQSLAELQLPAPGTPIAAPAAQALAIQVARRGTGQVAPNPLVGAVLVDQAGRFLAAGAHERLGDAHAEINALRQVTVPPSQIVGSTLYVTLEPCAHVGKTPACAPELVAAGIRKVVYGAVDPNPRVNGKGLAILNAGGIETAFATDWADDCRALAAVYLTNAKLGRPFVALKAAVSLDGVIARQGAQRAWLTGPRARQYGHYLRTAYDAILIGRGTLVADNPHLNSRDALLPGRSPWRIVLDPALRSLQERSPVDWNLCQHQPDKVLWVATLQAWASSTGSRAQTALHALGAQTLALDLGEAPARFAAQDLLSGLSAYGITSLLVEGGAGAYAAFLDAGLIDRLHLFQAPLLLGAPGATRFTDHTERLKLSAASTLTLTPLGSDILLDADWT